MLKESLVKVRIYFKFCFVMRILVNKEKTEKVKSTNNGAMSEEDSSDDEDR